MEAQTATPVRTIGLSVQDKPGCEPAEKLRPVLLISGCLLGLEVRMDGGHARNRFLTDELGPYVTWQSTCPEMEAGLGTPRPRIRLVRDQGETPAEARLVTSQGGEDVMGAVQDASDKRVQALALDTPDGAILKKDSPSCGLFRVRVYDHNGSPTKSGQGVFARALTERFPHLPAEEEGRLNDPVLRENFILRIYTRARWRSLLLSDRTAGGLVRFHTAHKMIVLAHDPVIYRQLGKLVALGSAGDFEGRLVEYEALLQSALAKRATRGRHVNVLQHLAGFLSEHWSREDRAEFTRLLGDYRAGHVPLVVPLTLLRHHLRVHRPHTWAETQLYLRPYPKELMLRNQ